MVKVEQLRDEVIALKPVYTEFGNVTDILLKNGEVARDKRVLNSVIKALAASYAVDLKAQRRMVREKTDRKGMLPFYLGAGRIFIPLKMRQALTGKDSVYGYVDMAYMGEPQAGEGKGCLVPLSNGLQLQVLSSRSTVHGAQHSGQAALAIFQPYKHGDDQQEQIMEAGRVVTWVIVQILEQLDRIEHNTERKD